VGCCDGRWPLPRIRVLDLSATSPQGIERGISMRLIVDKPAATNIIKSAPQKSIFILVFPSVVRIRNCSSEMRDFDFIALNSFRFQQSP
jgi:hypothetical protein